MHATENWVRIETTATEAELQVASLEGHETISRPFEFEVQVVVAGDVELDPEQLVSREVALIFEQRDTSGESRSRTREMFRRHGIVVECTDRMVDDGHRAYVLKVVPRFWLASLVETLDIFMGMSVPDIIRQKLNLIELAEGIDYEMRLARSYEPREFIVQYKESDVDFVGRLTEHWGLSYFFEHRSGRDVIVFTDHNLGFASVDEGDGDGHVPFGARGERLGVRRIEQKIRAVPRLFVQRDYNYRQPGADLTATTEMPDGMAGGIVEYGGHFKTEEEGKYLATVRAEEHRARRFCVEGESGVPSFQGGARVTVDGTPRGDLGLVLTAVHHEARQATLLASGGDVVPYRNRFEAIPEAVTFRPPRRTPKPKVHGVLTGIVDAEQKGKYAELDEEGRYRVKFMFDTSGPAEGKASRPVRMMQPHTGAGYGMHFPLRPGVEVLVTFVDGDPDRPIIAGTVPNPQTQSPVIAENAARNVLRTGGGNEINIDDAEGKERIKLSCPASNTVFQLGAPNSPEMGAILTTAGAIANISLTGSAATTSISNSVSVVAKFAASNVISTVASKPDALAWTQLVFDLAKTAVPTLTFALDELQNLAEIVARSAETETKWRESLVRRAESQRDKADADLKKARSTAELADVPSAERQKRNPDGSLAVDAGKKAVMESKTVVEWYEADRAAVDAAYEALAKARTAKKEAEVGLLAGTAELKQQEIEELEKKLTEAKTTLQASEGSLRAFLATAQPSATASAYLKSIDEYDHYQALKEVEIEHRRRLDAIVSWCRDSDFAQVLSTAKSARDLVAKGVDVLYTVVISIWNFVKWLKESIKEDGEWAQAALLFNEIAPQATPSAKSYGFGFEPGLTWAAKGLGAKISSIPRHTVGSDGNMTVFGKGRVLVHSPMLVLCGTSEMKETDAATKIALHAIQIGKGEAHKKGSIVAVAEHNTILTAKERAELNGYAQSVVASQTEVLISAKQQPALLSSSGTRAPAGSKIPEAKIVAKQQGTLLLDATDRITAKAGKLAAEVEGDVGISAAKSIGLVAGDAIALSAGAWSGELSKDDGVELGNGTQRMRLTTDEAWVGHSMRCGVSLNATRAVVTGQDVELIADTTAQITATGRVLLG